MYNINKCHHTCRAHSILSTPSGGCSTTENSSSPITSPSSIKPIRVRFKKTCGGIFFTRPSNLPPATIGYLKCLKQTSIIITNLFDTKFVSATTLTKTRSNNKHNSTHKPNTNNKVRGEDVNLKQEDNVVQDADNQHNNKGGSNRKRKIDKANNNNQEHYIQIPIKSMITSYTTSCTQVQHGPR